MGGTRYQLTGQRFGRLEVIGEAPRQNGQSMWTCRCDCGNVVERMGYHLVRGSIKSCGCVRKAKRHDLTGRVFGVLQAVEPVGTGAKGVNWRCVCTVCGAERVEPTYQLTSGQTHCCRECGAGNRRRGKVDPEALELPKPRPLKRSGKTLEQVAAAAKAAGVSYGRYVAMTGG